MLGLRRVAAIATTIVVAAMLTYAAPTNARDVNCSDFANQASAQAWFIAHGGPGQDPAGLDADHDVVACESLPCPCSGTGTPTPPAPTPTPPPAPTRCRRPHLIRTATDLNDGIDVCPQEFADTPDGCPLTSVYLGRLDLGNEFAPDHYLPIGTPARKPKRMTLYTHGGDAIVRVRWEGWGESPADGRGTARLVAPGRAGGKHDYKGVRIVLSRLRDGECLGEPALFYTRARVMWPKATHRRTVKMTLLTGCGRS